jgi:hypothetical protein
MGAMGSFLLLISSVRRGFLAFSLCWCKVRHLIRGLMLGLGSPASLQKECCARRAMSWLMGSLFLGVLKYVGPRPGFQV